MVDLRVIAALVVAAGATACRAADAEPSASSGLTPPAGWQALPSAAAAARAAVGAGMAVDGAEAWGDPARGCYALWIAVHGDTTAEELARDLAAGLASEHVVAKPQPNAADTLVFEIERSPYRGTLRATLRDQRVTALACVANQREPASCAAACKTFSRRSG